MKAILLLFIACSAFGQNAYLAGRASFQNADFTTNIAKLPASGWTDPSGASTLTYWWVGKDLTNAAVSVWTNRMMPGSKLITNGTAAVTWSVDHVVLTGLINPLTTSPGLPFLPSFSPTTNGWCAAVIFSQNQSTTTGEIIVSTNGFNHLDVLSDGASLRWEASTIATIAKNVIIDCLYNADGYVYTNGVSTGNLGGQSGALGFGGVSRLKGSIYEILFWTNGPLSSVNISNLHYYATNTYGYTP